MSWTLQGIGASSGRVRGSVRHIEWDLERVPHRTISPEEVDGELERFADARRKSLERTRELRERTARRLGEVEAKIFEPQALMIEDPDLVEGTVAYIRENYLSAERALDWRLLEIRSQFLDNPHAMVLDRLADLQDVRVRLLSRLLGRPDGEERIHRAGRNSLLAFQDLTPSVAVRLDSDVVAGLMTAAGSRASHSAVLARSLGIPAVVGIGPRLREIPDEADAILDGRTGRIIVEPTEEEREALRSFVSRSEARRERFRERDSRPTATADGERVVLQANLDQPDDAAGARHVGVDGVGLFRSEFLVIGRRAIPTEDEQYEAYRKVVEAFPGQEVTLRTFDIGGDKFPIFLNTPAEENPYLGWRAIRVCLDKPDLFRNQLRAALRASRHGRLRLLLPFIVSVDEIRRTRDLLRLAGESVEGVSPTDSDDSGIDLGIMMETPAAAGTIDILAPHIDFLSLGTNDLTQYVIAVDRGSGRLANLYDPLHPALFRLYARIRREASRYDLEIGVCGDLAAEPVGAAALLGLGYRTFSLPVTSILEIRECVRSVSTAELSRICHGLADSETAAEIRAPLEVYLEGALAPATAPADRMPRSV